MVLVLVSIFGITPVGKKSVLLLLPGTLALALDLDLALTPALTLTLALRRCIRWYWPLPCAATAIVIVVAMEVAVHLGIIGLIRVETVRHMSTSVATSNGLLHIYHPIHQARILGGV